MLRPRERGSLGPFSPPQKGVSDPFSHRKRENPVHPQIPLAKIPLAQRVRMITKTAFHSSKRYAIRFDPSVRARAVSKGRRGKHASGVCTAKHPGNLNSMPPPKGGPLSKFKDSFSKTNVLGDNCYAELFCNISGQSGISAISPQLRAMEEAPCRTLHPSHTLVYACPARSGSKGFSAFRGDVGWLPLCSGSFARSHSVLNFRVSTWPIGCDTPSAFSERFPLGEHAKCRCNTPPTKGGSQRYLCGTT